MKGVSKILTMQDNSHSYTSCEFNMKLESQLSFPIPNIIPEQIHSELSKLLCALMVVYDNCNCMVSF